MIDGTMYHGGICDRFKGIISSYNYCRYVGKPFRIRYNFPFELTDYIVPNKYDWRNPNMKILVTADSITFLKHASELDFVYAIKGEGTLAHVDIKNTPQSDSIKQFVDFYMIAGARKVYGVTIDKMYNSNFPVYAAKVGNVPFIRIEKRQALQQ